MSATLKPGWKMPEPPAHTSGHTLRPIAFDTGDGWWIGYDCEDCGGIDGHEEGFIRDWPFVEDSASGEDLRRAGFEII